MASGFGSSGFGNSSNEDTFSSINVTPLVDVVLVLLILFMITAPAIYQSALQVHLPKAKSGETTTQKLPLNFTLSKEGSLTWNEELISWETLNQKLLQLKSKATDPEQPVLISADTATPHGTVIRLMDILKEAGLSHFAISVQK